MRSTRNRSVGGTMVGAFALFMTVWGGAQDEPARDLLLLRGADGDPAFADRFETMVQAWRAAAEAAGDVDFHMVQDRETLQSMLKAGETGETWIVMVGHGTDDGRSTKFNFDGEDLPAETLAAWLDERGEAPVVVINTTSASGPFVPALAGPERVVMTATKSGEEVNLTRFGLFLAEALQDPTADLNKDEQNSILECFLLAAKRTAESYEEEGRLATEHSLLDDNGDGKGIRAEWFEGLRLAKRPTEDVEPDGDRARRWHLIPGEQDRRLTPEQRRRRDALEQEVEEIVAKRGEMVEEDYYDRLEKLFRELAEIYEASDS